MSAIFFGVNMKEYTFKKAHPIWAKGREKEINLWLDFSVKVPKSDDCRICLTSNSYYSLRVNGEFFCFGPARAAKGFYRVDELDLSKVLTEETNDISIRVAGYYFPSFYTFEQDSFLCAEVIDHGKVLYATGSNGFDCSLVPEHEQEVQKFSYQRTFVEIYNIGAPSLPKPEMAVFPDKKYICRDSSYNTFFPVPADKIYARGRFHIGDHKDEFKYPYYINKPEYKTYFKVPKTDLALLSRNIDQDSLEEYSSKLEGTVVHEGEYYSFKMPYNVTGMISVTFECDDDCELLIRHDEILRDGPDKNINWRVTTTLKNNLIRVKGKGTHRVETFEPYTMKYVEIYSLKGTFTVKDFHIIFFGADEPKVRYNGDDEKIRKIFDAAVMTYRENTFTVYMDCPERERAGWLCDSFFTSRVEKVLYGNSEIEHVFLENFVLPEKFDDIPDGMIPMIYPGESFSKTYINTWAMWYVIELKEYLDRTGDRDLVEKAKSKVYGLKKWIEQYLNESGLIEKIDGWTFVEWSHANDLTMDVNYPVNMVFSGMLDAMAYMYNDDSCRKQSEYIKKAINEQALVGDFYCDNAVRDENGVLKLSGEITEACQYYAFFFNVATKEKNSKLWDILLKDFGPDRQEKCLWKEVWPANAFIGNYLRLDVLFREKCHKELLENIKGYFYGMAESTGTLWEYMAPQASCCHGFASYVLYWLDGMGLLENM